ncbi:OmpW family protein [Fulvivirga sedimenti]|uniref:OmpW family protein n=1 Tax=Fulvivirga sedimenti TaxID=2879465 RepID=A0A9X1HZ11_9BACT|nr:OmpW family protein [Fulvivirga sedimenti]MCA6079049.1 OmpW family protein [Fulvivirga sedimenti]
MKKILIIALLSFVVSFGASAQNMSTIMYNVAIPMGDLKDYISPVSARGVSYDYQFFMTDNFALGGGIGWQVFYEDIGFFESTDGTATISGYQYRYLNSYPAHITGTYFLDNGGTLIPYAGLGIGVIHNRRETDFGIFAIQDNAWHFSFRPEVGLMFDVNYRFAMKVNTRYVQGFNTKDLNGQNYLALGLGFVFRN